MNQLLEQQSVYKAATESDVPALLQSIGINPAVRPERPSNLMSMRRHDQSRGTDYYFLYNQGNDQIPPRGTEMNGIYEGLTGTPNNIFEEPEACRTTGLNPCTCIGEDFSSMVTFEGNGQPFVMDAWSGEIEPVALYTTDGEHVTFRIDLACNESMLVGITQNSGYFGLTNPGVYVTGTDADDAVQVEGGSLAIKASKAGTYTTRLSDGNTVSTTIESVPAVIDLTNVTWHLSAEDWQPANEYGTMGTEGAKTTKNPIELDLITLKPWPDIPELANASGAGTYSVNIELPADWKERNLGAYLHLGQVVDAFTLWINGHEVAVDQVAAKADIGEYLQGGINEIVVRVSTTLNNRLAVLHEGVASCGLIQEYGLTGPVILSPYRQEIILQE